MPSTKPAGWLVVGTGRHAETYGLPALAACRSGAAIALCGSDAAHTAQVAARHGIAFSATRVEDMLADPAVTHVYVCSANADHDRHVSLAATAGKHVLCEKPIATNVASARTLITTANRHRVTLGTGFHLRHNAAHVKAQQLIADGVIGHLIWVRIDYLHTIVSGDSPERLRNSRDTGTPSRGTMAGTGAHAVDLARWLLSGDFCTVAAEMAEVRSQANPRGEHRLIHVQGKSSNGALITLNVGRARFPDNGVAILGTEGRIAISDSIGNRGGGVVRVVADHHVETFNVPAHDVYAAQFDAFTAASDAGLPASASGADGLASLLVAEAVEQSLAESSSRRLSKASVPPHEQAP